MAFHTMLIVDDRSRPGFQSELGASWRCLTDLVMGGVSEARLETDWVGGKSCLRLRGSVRLENNGGFAQMALDLGQAGVLDVSGYAGLRLEVMGNGQTYNAHVRTADTRLPWQSYRSHFIAGPVWQTIELPVDGFKPHRIGQPLDLRQLRRLGLVAIGRAFQADLCVARVWFYATPALVKYPPCLPARLGDGVTEGCPLDCRKS